MPATCVRSHRQHTPPHLCTPKAASGTRDKFTKPPCMTRLGGTQTAKEARLGQRQGRRSNTLLKSPPEIKMGLFFLLPRPLVCLPSCLQLRVSPWCKSLDLKPRVELVAILTNLRRKVFSRSAPMHPANPRMNITPPTFCFFRFANGILYFKKRTSKN